MRISEFPAVPKYLDLQTFHQWLRIQFLINIFSDVQSEYLNSFGGAGNYRYELIHLGGPTPTIFREISRMNFSFSPLF